MDKRDEVAKWFVAADALHAGALEHYASGTTFPSTTEIISYLCNFRNTQGYSDPSNEHCLATAARDRDYFYLQKNIDGTTLGLGTFFKKEQHSACLLCDGASFYFDNITSQYKLSVTEYANKHDDDDFTGDDLNLRRLEHLATLHTPYFVMLFVGLVEQKRHVFHMDTCAINSMANHLIRTLSGAGEGGEHRFKEEGPRQRSDSAILKLWWRYQDRRSSSKMNVSIPSYFTLVTNRDNQSWTPAFDAFEARKPDPLYTFVRDKCLCHELPPDGLRRNEPQIHREPRDLLAVRMRVIPRANVLTFVMSTPIPKRHLEYTLHNAVSVHKAGVAALREIDAEVNKGTHRTIPLSTSLEPQLDCIGIEQVNSSPSVILHVVSTLCAGWMTLDSWLTESHTQLSNADDVGKVLVGVLGSLRRSCAANQRPCRVLYMTDEMHGIPTLSSAFLVHRETGETLSLLPYVSMSTIYRASMLPQDELQFRTACLRVALSVLYAGTLDRAEAMERMDAVRSWWDYDPQRERCEDEREPNAKVSGDSATECAVSRFCRTGLMDSDLWSLLKSATAGHGRRASFRKPDEVWLGRGCVLKDKFAWLKKAESGPCLDEKNTRKDKDDVQGDMCLLEVLKDSDLSWGGVARMQPEYCEILCSFLSHMDRYPQPERLNLNMRRKRMSETRDVGDVAQKVMTLCVAESMTTQSSENHGLECIQKFIDEELTKELNRKPSTLLQSAWADSPITHTKTYRDEDFPTPEFNDKACAFKPQEPFHFTFTDNLSFAESEDFHYNPETVTDWKDVSTVEDPSSHTDPVTVTEMELELDREPESLRTASRIRSLFGEEDTNFTSSYSSNTVFSETAKDKIPDTDMLHQAAEFFSLEHVSNAMEGTRVETSAWSSETRSSTEHCLVQEHVPEPDITEHSNNDGGSRPDDYDGSHGSLPDAAKPRPSGLQHHRVDDPQRVRQHATPEALVHGEITHGEFPSPSQKRAATKSRRRTADKKRHGGLRSGRADPRDRRGVTPHVDRITEEDDQVDAEEDVRHASLLRENTMRLLSRGVTAKDLKNITTGRPTFHEMTYEVSENIKALKRLPTIPQNTKGPEATYISHPSQGLERPKRDSVWDRQNVLDRGNVVTLNIVSSRSIPPHKNWALGQERSGSKDGSAIKVKLEGADRTMTWSKCFPYTPTVNRRTLDCETAQRSYCPINLSAPPCSGFSHTELLVNSLPTLVRDDVKHLISMKTTQMNHLGVVSTGHDIPGLILHKTRTHYDTLVNILDMHTRLQVHSFVPRTFALHGVMDDRKPHECVGIFVGETPGSMNLGRSDGVLMSTSYNDTITFTYHVLRCLLRVQILSLRVLGFTMRLIQPARIWRVDDGFRVDMLGCLMDTLHVWGDKYPKWGGREGLASIWNTLTQLGIQKHVPEAIAKVFKTEYYEHIVETMGLLTENLTRPNDQRSATTMSWTSVDVHQNAERHAVRSSLDDEEMLLRMYDLCDFPDSTAHHSERWDILGLNGAYKELLLPINNKHTVHPYGPFYIKVHNQVIKWNRAIVVEPLTSGLPFAQLDPDTHFTEDVLARALLDTFASDHYLEQRECSGSTTGNLDVVRVANEALRVATENEDSWCYSTYYTR